MRNQTTLVITATAGLWLFAGCAPSQPPAPQLTSPAPTEPTVGSETLSSIGIGTEGEMAEVGIDAELAMWLNTVDSSGASEPPVPRAEAWQPFSLPSASDSILFSTRGEPHFDVLEILAYPDGLDEDGVPTTVEVHPLCGPQASVLCSDVARGSSDVMIPRQVVATAIIDTEYYAIGGVILPGSDSHPTSFMALMRKVQ